ncbi:hypothetical protein NC653_012854 [Populus alba x Populus x berolinensis]|uniref:Uncharacterized protein n=1 Tax=Populus alba x Populus x berolinensis TaxID=444605 RepID=A0AAD6W2C6_9ROSI|nr:hypothetical protein NC653_012854 [Populus alba x Populus x berolinensis]
MEKVPKLFRTQCHGQKRRKISCFMEKKMFPFFQLLKMWVPVCFSCEQLPAIKTPAAGVQLRQPTK